jgi:tripartite-type tricarboxylate transporter receptor subunit TctC
MKLLRLLAALVFVAAAAGSAVAQGFPAKPIRLLVPFPPGGGVDTLARVVGEKLSSNVGQPVIVENKPGAGGQIGVEAAARAPADGYTVLVGSPGAMSVAPSLNPRLPYRPLEDFAPVSMGVRISNILVVHPALPAKSVVELIALAKKEPGKLSFASGGTGTSQHLAGELFRLLAGVDILHVPYKGTAPAMNDLVGGQTQMLFSDPSVLALVKSGKLRALAQTTPVRSPALPDLPTLAESGVAGYDATNWYAFFVPAATPAAVVATLNAELVKVLNSADVKARLSGAGMDPSPSTPQELGAFVREDTARWAGVVKAAGVRVDQ